MAKKKLSLFQLSLLSQLKNNGKIRVTMDRGLQAVMLDRNDKIRQNRIFINTIELLSSDNGRGKFLKVISKTEDEIIYGISKKGLQVLDKESKVKTMLEKKEYNSKTLETAAENRLLI